MFFLTKQDLLQLVSSSTATLDVTVLAEDATSGKVRRTYKISTATTTTIHPNPINNATVKTIIISNTHASTSSDVILRLNDGTNNYVLHQATIPAKYTLHYSEAGIQLYTDDGTSIGGVDGGAP